LAAGLEFVETTTPARIGEHERRLAQSFVEQIRDMSEIRIFSGQVGVISVAVEEPQEAAAVLDQSFGIACRAGLHCAPGTHRQLGTFPQGTLRFSFGYFNTDADVRAAADALRAVAKSV
jgi:selenocysteine lyase/cysteine desulfurase